MYVSALRTKRLKNWQNYCSWEVKWKSISTCFKLLLLLSAVVFNFKQSLSCRKLAKCMCVCAFMILIHNSYKTNTHPRLLTDSSVCFCLKRNQEAHIAEFSWEIFVEAIHTTSYPSEHWISIDDMLLRQRESVWERWWCIEWAKHYYDNFLSWIAMDMFTLCLKQIIPINI